MNFVTVISVIGKLCCFRAVYAVLGHILDAEESLSDVITKTEDYLWLKVREIRTIKASDGSIVNYNTLVHFLVMSDHHRRQKRTQS